MSRRFITANRAQSFLLPPSIDDWVEEGHLVRFMSLLRRVLASFFRGS